jgi:hypothetical protein
VARWILVLCLVAVLGAACTSGVDEVTASLSPAGPTITATVSPSGTASPTATTGGVRPAIVVRSPGAGDEIVSPVTVSGTADVFEAVVSIAILDASGQELAATSTMASCGTGCRGRYSATVAFFTPARQTGTVEVFERSAKDGSPINVVSVPVVLVPG